MKTTQSTLLILFGTLATLSCFAQGGGSVNGPDLKGVMITSEADGEIPSDKASEAITQCYKLMGEKVLENILGRKVKLGLGYGQTPGQIYSNNDLSHVTNWELTPDGKLIRSPGFNSTNKDTPALKLMPNDLLARKPKYDYSTYEYYYSVSYRYLEQKNRYDFKETLYFDYGFSRYKPDDSLYISLTTLNAFPKISYRLNNKSVYGELGELITKKAFISELQFEKSDTQVFKLYAIRDDKELIPTKIEIRLDTLANCIRSKLTQ